MYLKALTIRGFKSFARKTILQFEPGVTIIVGPNGSGKSNIADAVMWVLGEQSPTSLRGNRMEDVIFSGSAALKPVSLAEVTLTLDNSNNDFPLDFSEVSITRNVVRGGDNDYRLNNTSCRLLDIQELLSDAGVGRTLNSVISQNQLEDVLSCRPEERRSYIEEAGGLLKYRRRREKAERRLARLDDDLVRIGDIMREVKGQLRPLARQAGRLEQYKDLTRELREASLRLDTARLRGMRAEWDAHQAVQEERSGRLEVLDGRLRELTSEAEGLERASEQWRTRESGLREGLYRLVAVHEQLKALRPAWEERRGGPGAADDPAAIARLEEEISGAEARLEEASERFRRLAGQLEGYQEKERALKAGASRVARELAAAEARLELLRAPVAAAVPTADVVEKKEAELSVLDGELSRDDEKLDSIRKEAEELRGERSKLEGEIEATRTDREGILEKLRDAEVEQSRIMATLDLLHRLDSSSWSVANTAGALIDGDPTGGRLGGTLAESLKIEPRYERAIMEFLGPWAFAVLAKDGDAVKAAIEYLKEKGLGQSLFLRSSGSPEPPPGLEEAPAPDGVTAARDVVEAPWPFNDALEALLAGVFLVGDLEEAFAVAGRYPNLVFLTPDGDVISGGTLLKGGSPTVNPVHLEMTRTRREGLEDSLGRVVASLEELGLGLEALGKSRAGLEARLEGITRVLEEKEADLMEVSTSAASGRGRVEALRDELERMTAAPPSEDSAAEIERCESVAATLRGSEESLAGETREAELDIAKVSSEVRAVELEMAGIEKELDIFRGRRERLERRAEAGDGAPADELAGAIGRLDGLHSRLLSLVERSRERARAELEEGAARERDSVGRIRELRDRMVELRGQHEELIGQVHAEELSRAELKVKVEQLVERIVDGHKVPVEFALKQYPDEGPTDELQAAVDELTEKLEHIGPVNPEAITERETLQRRYEFLKGQIDDIEESKAQLRKVIKRIDREIREKFKHTADEVNRHFSEIFGFLFPNGRAQIRLSDPDNLLDTGVEILAQPEGKKLRRISLLSGGEMALTAIAFFFALFRVRPSPFYFLDEVEAALDDINLHRFLELVRQFKGESQLVLITHQKRSMEIADILYGVSMQDDGISRVVSQRIAS